MNNYSEQEFNKKNYLRPQVLGFTLIELLLALSIFAALGVLTSITLSSVLKTDEVTEIKSVHLAAMQRAQLFLRRDIGQVVSRPIRDEFGTSLPALKGNSAGIEFTRTGWRNPVPENNVRSELQRVSYFMEEGELVRRYWYVLDRSQDTQPVERSILKEVDNFSLRYFDASNKQWLEAWPPLDEDRKTDLPAVIEITVNTKPFDVIVRLVGLSGYNN